MAVTNSMFFQLKVIKNVVRPGNVPANFLTKIFNRVNVSLYSTATVIDEKPSSTEAPKKKLSRAMLAYLERAKAHDIFIKKETEDYFIGKRHLANMMGEDPEHFTQKDVDRAIEYLFPSGLFDKKARPLMRPPEEIFPSRKAAEFDQTGRPYHTMFYTISPNYFQALYDTVEELDKLKKVEDEMISKGIAADPTQKLKLDSSTWLSNSELNKLLYEEINEKDYEYFISTLTRLLEHPYAHLSKDFLMKWRKEVTVILKSLTFLPIEHDSEGRSYVTVPDCKRKSARGTVIVKDKGSGKIVVNGKPLVQYFTNFQEREQIIFPLQFTGMMDKMDVEATVVGGGSTGQSGCIRWGIAWGLRSFVEPDINEKMRIAGLLTRDWRKRERKKPGQEGARRKFTWKKR